MAFKARKVNQKNMKNDFEKTHEKIYDKTNVIRAGFLSLFVHAGLIALLFISLNWKTQPTQSVAEVNLWDALPVENAPPTLPQVQETPPPVEEEKKTEVVEKVEEKAPEKIEEDIKENEIALEKAREKRLEEQRLEEKRLQKEREEAKKKEKELEQKKILAELKKEMTRDQPQKENKTAIENKAKQDALKKLQQEALAEENAAGAQQASAAAAKNAGEIDQYKAKIIAKIKGNVNKSLCGTGNPVLRFEIGLLPTGELSGQPKLVKSSGNEVCDEAVERAIFASEPLPLPSDASLLSQFRNLNLTFKPNE